LQIFSTNVAQLLTSKVSVCRWQPRAAPRKPNSYTRQLSHLIYFKHCSLKKGWDVVEGELLEAVCQLQAMGAVGSCLKPKTKYGALNKVQQRRTVKVTEITRPEPKGLVQDGEGGSFATVRADRDEESFANEKLAEVTEKQAKADKRATVEGEVCEDPGTFIRRGSDDDPTDVQVEQVSSVEESEDVNDRVEPAPSITVEIPGPEESGEKEVSSNRLEGSKTSDPRAAKKMSIVLTKAAMFDYRDAEARLDDETLVKSGLLPKDVLPPRPNELIDQPISDVSSLSSLVGRPVAECR